MAGEDLEVGVGGDAIESVKVAQMGLVFNPLYRLTVGGLMLVLGGVLCVYGAIYTPNPSCNMIPDYDIAIGGLLIACGCSHLLGMCISNGSRIRMQVHMCFDVCCIGVPLMVLFLYVNMEYWVLTRTQKKDCPQDLQYVTLMFLAFMYAAFLVGCCCSPCIAATIKPGKQQGDSKTFIYREEDVAAADVYINQRNDKIAGTGYGDDDTLLDRGTRSH